MSRKLIISLALALLFISPIMAEETGGADWDNDLTPFNGVRDYVAGHDHEVEEREVELGAGLDVIVYQSDISNLFPEEVTVEGRYDFNNEEGSVYLVAKYNLFSRLFGE